MPLGVSAVAQQDQQCLGCSGMQVRSLAKNTGLRIWCSHSHSLSRKHSSDLNPSPGTPYTTGHPKKGKKNKQTNKKTQNLSWLFILKVLEMSSILNGTVVVTKCTDMEKPIGL